MVVCPMCEHQQEFGLECEVCGKELANLGALGAPPVSADRMDGLELNRVEPVGDVPFSAMIDLERHHIDAVATPAIAAERKCRYCQNVQAAGAVCDKCGMRLPRIVGASSVMPSTAAVAQESHMVRCRACGIQTAAGALCTDCGQPVPSGIDQ